MHACIHRSDSFEQAQQQSTPFCRGSSTGGPHGKNSTNDTHNLLQAERSAPSSLFLGKLWTRTRAPVASCSHRSPHWTTGPILDRTRQAGMENLFVGVDGWKMLSVFHEVCSHLGLLVLFQGLHGEHLRGPVARRARSNQFLRVRGHVDLQGSAQRCCQAKDTTVQKESPVGWTRVHTTVSTRIVTIMRLSFRYWRRSDKDPPI